MAAAIVLLTADKESNLDIFMSHDNIARQIELEEQARRDLATRQEEAERLLDESLAKNQHKNNDTDGSQNRAYVAWLLRPRSMSREKYVSRAKITNHLHLLSYRMGFGRGRRRGFAFRTTRNHEGGQQCH
jgi:hypothetical protein